MNTGTYFLRLVLEVDLLPIVHLEVILVHVRGNTQNFGARKFTTCTKSNESERMKLMQRLLEKAFDFRFHC